MRSTLFLCVACLVTLSAACASAPEVHYEALELSPAASISAPAPVASEPRAVAHPLTIDAPSAGEELDASFEVSGRAAPGAAVSVLVVHVHSLEVGQEVHLKADEQGRWSVQLDVSLSDTPSDEESSTDLYHYNVYVQDDPSTGRLTLPVKLMVPTGC